MDMEKGSQVIEKNMSKIVEVSFNESIFQLFFLLFICIIVICKILNEIGVSMQVRKQQLELDMEQQTGSK